MDSNQLWGDGENITSNQRHRSSAAKTSLGNGDYSDDENLFDIIGRELDEREEEARREQQQQQQQCLQEQNDGRDNTSNYQTENSQSGDDDEVDFSPMRNDWTAVDGTGNCPANNEWRNEAANNDSSHDQLETTDAKAAMVVPRTISKRRREYSVVKSTTPRFSFQSSVKSTTSTVIRKSPMERHSISSSPKSDKQHPKKSVKRVHRHSFRQSIDRNASKSTADMTQVNINMRELGFAPTFLANSRAAAFTNADAIGEGDDDDARTKRKWNRLSSSQAAVTSPFKQSSSGRRNKTGGYLIQNLRSLRNNDQRMAMRLRASTGGYSSAPMASKRRRSSSGGGSSISQVAASELDVTVMDAAVPNQNVPFGAGKIRLAYIRRYTGAVDFKLPCYSWIALPQNVMNEQSIGEGEGKGSTQLRCYDAIIIPPRVASISTEGQPIPLNGLEKHELPLPTIICANVCERCTTDTCTNNDMSPMHEVSFDMLCK